MEATLAEQRRSEISVAALKVFAQKGYHAAKIEDIASELSIGHGTLYRYFENKLDIFNKVIDDIIRMITELVQEVDPNEADTLEEYQGQLKMIGDGMFDLFLEHPEIGKLLFFEAFGINDQGMQARIHDIFVLFGEYTKRYLVNGVNKGYLHAELHIRETALAINAALFEACRRVVSAPNPEKALRTWKETIINLMLRGIVA